MYESLFPTKPRQSYINTWITHLWGIKRIIYHPQANLLYFKLISKRFIKVSQTGLALKLWKKSQKGRERGESLNSFRGAFQSRSCEAALRRGAHAQDAGVGARGGRTAAGLLTWRFSTAQSKFSLILSDSIRTEGFQNIVQKKMS